MFDFDVENAWDVDKASETLNTSLFGKSKKSKGRNTSRAILTKSDKQSSFIIHDSDDEQFSKKGKRKLKERRRRKNKQNAAKIEQVSGEHAAENSGMTTGKEESPGQSQVKSTKSAYVFKSGKTPSQSPKQTANTELLTNKQKSKKEKNEAAKLNNDLHLKQDNNKRDRKRKRTPSMTTDGDSAVIDKKARLDDSKSSTIPPSDLVTEGGKKKRKRNRKKKNNSKKNKYKHLALNSKDESTVSTTSQPEPESGDQAIENEQDGKQSKSKKLAVQKIPNNKMPVKSKLPKVSSPTKSALDIDKSKHAIREETQIVKEKTSHKSVSQPMKKPGDSQNADLDPLTKKGKKRRKINNVTENFSPVEEDGTDCQPRLKVKKDQAHGHQEVPSGKMQHPTAMTHSKFEISALKVSKEFKLKQQKLLKILGETEMNGSGDVGSEKHPDVTKQEKRKKKSNQKQKNNVESPNLHKTKVDRDSQNLQNMKTNHANNAKKIAKEETSSKKIELAPSSVTSMGLASQSSPFASVWGKAAALGQQAKEKLNSARFRYINEQLYSCKGDEAMRLFKEDPDAFTVYHEGFENQVNKWPVSPLTVIIKQLKDKPKNLVVADFGCGDAKLAQSIPRKVHSFDLVAVNDRVTACDMSKTPLPNEKVDVAVFCLSLMGTNISDYVHEANRILKPGGLLKIAEVASRFSGPSSFIDGVCSHGFQFLNKRDLSEMFYMMDFRKVKAVKKSVSTKQVKLKPCIYKRR